MECGDTSASVECLMLGAGLCTRYRPHSYQAEERRRKKALTKTSCYRPADAALFIPATPGEELKKNIEKVVTEELERIGMTAKVVETGGVTMRSMLVRTDLTGAGCFPRLVCCVPLASREALTPGVARCTLATAPSAGRTTWCPRTTARRGTPPMPGWRPTSRTWRERRTAMLSTSTWSSTILITLKTSVYSK